MKKHSTLKFFFISLIFIIYSCNNNNPAEEKEKPLTKNQILLNEINKNCDLFDTISEVPIISATEVYQNLNSNNLIIDIRSGKDFASGHIKGAISLKLKEIIDYAQVSGFPEYNKVIIVCYTGQSASYGTAVLRMLGYNNVYSMEWGMTSWNSKFSKKWKKNTSDKRLAKLEKKSKVKLKKDSLPKINCLKNTGPEILYSRAKQLLKDGFGKAAADLKYIDAFARKIFIISYNNNKNYNSGHLKKSVNFYRGTLTIEKNLLYLPSDIKIVTCSNKGHESAFITAYLRMLGYDAKTLKYGANSFMNSGMANDRFSEKVINSYSYETSEYIEVEEEVAEGGC